MSTLKSRLELALETGEMTQAQLAKAAKISPAGISKLFTGKSLELKAAHAFTIARLCKVDAEWLATGKGIPSTKSAEKQPKTSIEQEFEPRHIDLLRMYKRLPKEIRYDIRNMIQTLAAAQRENFVSWIGERHDKAAELDEA